MLERLWTWLQSVATAELWTEGWSLLEILATVGGAIGLVFIVYNAIWGYWAKHRQARRRELQDEEDRQRAIVHGARLEEVQADVKRLLVQSPSSGVSGPGQTEQVAEAVETAAEEAEAGDRRMAQALELLRAGHTVAAEPLFRAVAEEKTVRVERDSREAAAAWRHLGAIAGLRDPARARLAYAKAVELDPSDPASQFWHGWLQKDAGNLAAAETAFERVRAAANREATDSQVLWARLGLGDVHTEEGHLTEALDNYTAARNHAERLTTSDPGNADWQRDLSVSHEKIGDVEVAQGDLAAALKSYGASLAIRERLAASDPGNAGWQRDLSVSHNKIGDVEVAQGDLAAALKSYGAAGDRRAAGGVRSGQRWLAARPRHQPRQDRHGGDAAQRPRRRVEGVSAGPRDRRGAVGEVARECGPEG